jgi:hypothetical protein
MNMKLSKLLATRQSLQRQAHLASLAHAWFTLGRLADRIARVGLHGLVRLQPPDPREQRYAATLTALEGSQAQLEEHFSDDDLLQFADAVALAVEAEFDEIEFNLEDLRPYFVAPLRFALEQARVTMDLDDKQPKLAQESNSGDRGQETGDS